MKTRLALVCLAAAAMSACSTKPQQSTTDSQPAATPTGAAPQRAPLDKEYTEHPEDAVSGAAVSCDDAGPCPESVGMLLGIEGDQSVRCTFWVIGPDTIATNSHCVPADLKTPGASCAHRLWALLPKTKLSAAATLDCDQVVYASTPVGTVTDVDFAFLRLKTPVGRPLLPVSREGVSDGLPVTLVKVHPDRDNPLTGTISVATCGARQQMIEVPSFSNPLRPIVTLSGCPAEQGNSGSPILDSTGQVRAILEGGAPSQGVGREPIVYGTNFACVPELPGLDFSRLPAECRVTPDSEQGRKDSAELVSAGEKKTLSALDAAVRLWAADAGEARWSSFLIDARSKAGAELQAQDRFRAVSPVSFAWAAPICIEPATVEATRQGWLHKTYPTLVSHALVVPIWRIERTLNEFDQAQWRLERVTEVMMQLSFDADAAHRTGRTHVLLDAPGLGLHSLPHLFDGQLGVCR